MLLSQVSEIKGGRLITKDSTNHLGEKEYQTYNAWREACKRINPNAQFEGDKDICQAKPGIGEWGGDKGVIYTKDGATKDSRSDDIQRMIEKLEDSLDSITSGPRVAEIKAKIQELETQLQHMETGETSDSILTDILGNVSDFLAQVMGAGKAKDCKAEDGGVGSGKEGHKTNRPDAPGTGGSGSKNNRIQMLKAAMAVARKENNIKMLEKWKSELKKLTSDSSLPSPYSDVAQDKNIAALIELFSSDKEIKDHEVFHALAAQLGIENPSDLEEMAYAMLQSYFSKGKYMTQGGDKPIDPKELAMGDKTEREHTDNPVFARKIALDHLSEIHNYYTLLAQMEKGVATTDGQHERFVAYLKDKGVTEEQFSQMPVDKKDSLRKGFDKYLEVHFKDGGPGSGKKGHVTAKQIAAMKARMARPKVSGKDFVKNKIIGLKAALEADKRQATLRATTPALKKKIIVRISQQEASLNKFREIAKRKD